MTHPNLNRLQRKGFVLVVTLSLLVLLAVIAVGLLSLSAVTLRSGSREQARMEAQANARMSGENQKAHLPKLYQPKTDTASGWADQTRSHAVSDPEVFELESLLTDPAPAKDEPVKTKQE